MIDEDMNHMKLSKEEKRLRQKIARKMREMIKSQLPITAEDGMSLASEHRGFFCRYRSRMCIR